MLTLDRGSDTAASCATRAPAILRDLRATSSRYFPGVQDDLSMEEQTDIPAAIAPARRNQLPNFTLEAEDFKFWCVLDAFRRKKMDARYGL